MVRERNTSHPLLGRVGGCQVRQVIGVGHRVDRSHIVRAKEPLLEILLGLKKKANYDSHISGVTVSQVSSQSAKLASFDQNFYERGEGGNAVYSSISVSRGG